MVSVNVLWETLFGKRVSHTLSKNLANIITKIKSLVCE